MRAVQAEASARAATPRDPIGQPIVAALPPVAREALSLAVANPKLHERDIQPHRMERRKVDLPALHKRAEALADQQREAGDPRAIYIAAVAHHVGFYASIGDGYARLTFERLGKLAKCCRETARKVVRLLERKGLIDTFNVLTWRDGKLWRGANLYIVRAEAPSAAESWASSICERLERYAGWFGLKARAWGLNATPATVGLTPWRRAPAAQAPP